MTDTTVKRTGKRRRTRRRAEVILRRAVGCDWVFSKDDARMHLETVACEGRERVKVWLETDTQRSFELAEGELSARDLKRLEARIAAARPNIEAMWASFMIENGWLKADIAGHIVTLTAYPGAPGAFTRSIDLKEEFPGAYGALYVERTWDDMVVLVSLDSSTSSLAVGPKEEMDDRNHFRLEPIFWGALLPERWSDVFGMLESRFGANAPVLKLDNCWHFSFYGGTASTSYILNGLPGDTYEHVAISCSELCDHTGEGVDYESQSGLYHCEVERAIFYYSEHWQAGLDGSLILCPDHKAYREALWALRHPA